MTRTIKSYFISHLAHHTKNLLAISSWKLSSIFLGISSVCIHIWKQNTVLVGLRFFLFFFFNSMKRCCCFMKNYCTFQKNRFAGSEKRQAQTPFVRAVPGITAEGKQQTNTPSAGPEEEHAAGSQHGKDVHPLSSSSSSLQCQVQPGSSCQINRLSWLMDKQLTSAGNDYLLRTTAGLHNSGSFFLFFLFLKAKAVCTASTDKSWDSAESKLSWT